MATFDQFLPDINLSTPGCPVFERQRRIHDAVQAFCRESFAWRVREVALFTTVATQETYALTLPTDSELVAVHSAWANGQEVDIEEPGQGDDSAPGVPFYQWTVGMESSTSLRVIPAPSDGAIAVTGTISLCPTDTAATCADWLYTRWRMPIAAHALAALCLQPGKPWSNPGLGGIQSEIFKQGVMLAGSRAGPVRRKSLRVKIQDPNGYDSTYGNCGVYE
jgi:hypothetical protein